MVSERLRLTQPFTRGRAAFACNRRFAFFLVVFPNGVPGSAWERKDVIRAKAGRMIPGWTLLQNSEPVLGFPVSPTFSS